LAFEELGDIFTSFETKIINSDKN